MTESSTGGHALVAALIEQGVEVVFTLCGNHTLPIYQGLVDLGVEIVDTRTEAGAVFAADAYARVTRRPAVALVTGGPGLTNALTGLITANAIGSPVVLISGQNELALAGKGAQQELDQVAATTALCKWARSINHVTQIPALVDEAFRVAMSATTGAVHLSVPVDVARQPMSGPPRRSVAGVLEARVRPEDTFVDDVAELLRTAQRPVLVAGTGAYMSHAEDELTALAELTGLPVFTIDQARGLIPDAHPCAVGYADPDLNRAAARIAEADVVVLLGKWLDFRMRFGAETFIPTSAAIVEIGVDAQFLGRNRTPTLGTVCDIAAFLTALTERAQGWDFTAWTAELKAAVGPSLAGVDTPGGPGLHPLEVAKAVAAALPEPVTVVLDAGDFVQWCRSVLPATGPGRWLRTGPMSTCGAGTPLALGAKKGRPDEVVVLIVGDGSFGYHLAEIEAASRQGLPFVCIVGDNASWSLEGHLQRGLYGERYAVASELSSIRYDEIVRQLGGYGELVESLDGIAAAVQRAIASGRPACVQIPVSRVPSPLTHAVISRGGQV